jgi:chaperonin cofactor prefoldin
MKIPYAILLIMAVSLSSSLPVLGHETEHQDCENAMTVRVDSMGKVDEEQLQKHIDAVSMRMQEIQRSKGALHWRKTALHQHLSEMRVAMNELHERMNDAGCERAGHDETLAIRVKLLERHMSMLETMLSQLVDHIDELYKNDSDTGNDEK